MTIIEAAVNYLKEQKKAGKTVVLREHLLDGVQAQTHNLNRESIRMTLFPLSKEARLLELVSNDWTYLSNRQPPEFVLQRNTIHPAAFANNPSKDRSRLWISNLIQEDSPHILTLPGADGYDVEKFFTNRPNATVYCFDDNASTFKSWLTKPLSVKTVNIQSEIGTWLDENRNHKFHLINYDGYYVSQKMFDTLSTIDNNRQANVVAVGFGDYSSLRNHGVWKSKITAQLGTGGNMSRKVVHFALKNNYIKFDEMSYLAQNGKEKRLILAFKRRD